MTKPVSTPRTKKWRKKNKEKQKAYVKAWKEKNKDALVRHANKRRASRIKRTPGWLSEDDWWMIEEIYELAEKRSQATKIRWVVDHIVPLQGKTVSGLHTPSNLQIISYLDNACKSNKWDWNLQH